MRDKQRIERFSNLDEFGSVVENLDDYQSLPITVKIGDKEVSGTIRAMTNVTDGHITMAVGKKYPVFDHKTSLGYVIKELETRSCNVHGNVTVVGDTTFTHILFDGLKVKDLSSDVELGVEFVNPMDKKVRFLGHGYTFRQICSNGAGIKTMLPHLLISEKHTTDMTIRVPPMIHDFVGQSLGQSSHMQNLIDGSTKIHIQFNDEEQKYETLKVHFDGVVERHIKRIAEQIDTLNPSRWDLFNASNYVTSHYSVAPDIRSEIDRKAELFINPTFIINPVIIQAKPVVNRPEFMDDEDDEDGF